jgi:hypothetical protein
MYDFLEFLEMEHYTYLPRPNVFTENWYALVSTGVQELSQLGDSLTGLGVSCFPSALLGKCSFNTGWPPSLTSNEYVVFLWG